MSSHQDFIQKLRDQLEKLEYELDRFEHRAMDLKDEAREKLNENIQDLKHKKADLLDRMHQLEESGDRALDDIREGLEIAWDGIKLGLLAARSEFKDDDEERD